jgi:hypothetical protein
MARKNETFPPVTIRWIAGTVAYQAAAVRHLVRHSESGGTPDWSDMDNRVERLQN